MSQKLHLWGFKWVEKTSQFNEEFIKDYNQDSDTGYFIEADVQYSKKWHELHNDLLFLPEWMKIEKVEKFVTNLHDKKEHITYIRNLKEALNQTSINKST